MAKLLEKTLGESFLLHNTLILIVLIVVYPLFLIGVSMYGIGSDFNYDDVKIIGVLIMLVVAVLCPFAIDFHELKFGNRKKAIFKGDTVMVLDKQSAIKILNSVRNVDDTLYFERYWFFSRSIATFKASNVDYVNVIKNISKRRTILPDDIDYEEIFLRKTGAAIEVKFKKPLIVVEKHKRKFEVSGDGIDRLVISIDDPARFLEYIEQGRMYLS